MTLCTYNNTLCVSCSIPVPVPHQAAKKSADLTASTFSQIPLTSITFSNTSLFSASVITTFCSRMDLCNMINGSKLAWGVAAVCVNLGSRYIIQDMSVLQQQIFGHPAFKRIAIFCMIFMATRDVLLSIAIAALVCMILEHALNEKSIACIAPGMCKQAPAVTAPTGQMQNILTRQLYARALLAARARAQQQQ